MPETIFEISQKISGKLVICSYKMVCTNHKMVYKPVNQVCLMSY